MISSTTLTYLAIALGGYLVRHLNLLPKLAGVLGGVNPFAPPPLNPAVPAAAHPLLDLLRKEMASMVQSAVNAGLADLQARIQSSTNQGK